LSRDFNQPYRGGFVDLEDGSREHRFALTIYFEDTDAAGIVYYANYLKFMERARSDMIRAAGVDQVAELKETGNAYAVAEVSIRYRKPAFLGDELIVVSTVQAIRAVSITIQQRVMRGDELVAEAMVTAAFLTPQQRPQRQPREWVKRFERIAARESDEPSTS
jgi:acyl-CoA thioester hydrolase